MEKKFVKIAVGIAICFLCIFLLTGCAKQEAETQVTDSMFTDNDMEIGYDEETATKITLTGDSAKAIRTQLRFREASSPSAKREPTYSRELSTTEWL